MSIRPLFLLSGILLITGPTRAQDSPARLTAYLDSLLPAQLAAWHIPGAAVAVVRDSSVWMAKGYGLADVAEQTPVDGAVTGFRVGSLSKPITAAAVLQLVGQGRLGLQNDVSAFLGEVKIARRFSGDLTLHQLLTHSSGLDDTGIGDAARRPEEVYSLEDLVRRHFVPQTLPPGLGYHYSNYGFALAGYLVERASGLPFADYAGQRIFAPLGMTNSTFTQPQPPAIRAQLATGYAYRNGAFHPLPLDYSRVAPADALITTAADMARFMLAVLGAGDSLLAPAQRIEFLSQQFTASPSPYGMAYAWHEDLRRGVRVLRHGGDQLGFSASLLLVPGLRLGIFIAQNCREGDLRWAVTDSILYRFLPPAPDLDAGLTPNPLYAGFDPARYTGWYRDADYPHHTLEKATYVLGFRGKMVQVEAAGPGALTFNGERYVVQQPDLFVHPKYSFLTRGFRRGAAGAFMTAGRDAFERIPWYAYSRVLGAGLVLSLVLSLLNVLVWPMLRRRQTVAETSAARRWRRATHWASGGWLLAFAVLAVLLTLAIRNTVQFDYGPTPALYMATTLLTLAAVVGVSLPLAAVPAWRHGWWGRGVRVLLVLQALVWALAVWMLNYANLLGWKW